MQKIKEITIADFNYPLPDKKIAKYPLKERDKSKLLVWNRGEIQQSLFHQIGDFLPHNSLLFFNETRVIHARFQFKKATGAAIEIFCLEPLSPKSEVQQAFEQKGWCEWRCYIGNAKKWKRDALELDVAGVTLSALLKERTADSYTVRFEWEEDITFADIMLHFGKIPLPPYLGRESQEEDKKSYQTVYAKVNGSVAAPTAGLHFTANVLEQLQHQGVTTENLILHVGAGTFKPVSSTTIGEHAMHEEQIIITLENIEAMLRTDCYRIAVGTTTLRTMESLYWFGVKLMVDGDTPFVIKQWDPYQACYADPAIDFITAINVVKSFMIANQLHYLQGRTSLMIAPSYQYRSVKGLVTNFHQPKSTLLLLVSALTGEGWKEIYEYALTHEFRFLSYGDSSLLLT